MADVRTAGLSSRAAAASDAVTGPIHFAIGAILLASLFMAFGDVAAKSLFDHMSIWELSIVRGAGAISLLVGLCFLMPKTVRLKTPLWPYLALRGLLMFTAFTLFFSSMPFMTIVEATALFFTAPLFMTVLSFVYLKERVGIYRLGAVCTGFAGVIVVMGWSPDQIRWVYLLPIGCAIAYAHAAILTRGIKGQVSAWAFGFWAQLIHGSCSVIGWFVCQALIMPLVEQGAALDHLVFPLFSILPTDTVIMVPIIILATFTHVLSSYAYRAAPVSIVSMFEYTYLIWAAILAYIILAEIPSTRAVMGLFLIAAAGMFVAYRENRGGKPKPT